MLNNKHGFTLLEMTIAITMFCVILLASTSAYIPIMYQFGQQTKIAESQTKTMVGLELLKNDLVNAGYGLPWSFSNPINYLEYTDANNPNPAAANDSPSNVPRAIVVGNNLTINGALLTTMPNTDYLVVKSALASNLSKSAAATCGSQIVANKTSKKWTYMYSSSAGAVTLNIWQNDITTPENMANGADNVIVLNTSGADAASRNVLITGAASSFATPYRNDGTFAASFQPNGNNVTYILYGIDNMTHRMPFNRADYYVSQRRCSLSPTTYCTSAAGCTTAQGICSPSYCADGTGVLVKASVSHTDGSHDIDTDGFPEEIPILDCVADFQVVLGLDTDGDGIIGTYTDLTGFNVTEAGVNLASITALLADPVQLRTALKSIHLYILTHEGIKDKSFTYPAPTIRVGEALGGATVLGDSIFNLAAINNYKQYRWRVLKMTIQPTSLYPQ